MIVNVDNNIISEVNGEIMVHAKVKELKDMFNIHYTFYNTKPGPKNNSHRLLLFYAVECGLKVLILNKIKGHTTEWFTKHVDFKDKFNGHDIKYMLKYLNYNSFKLPEIKCKNGYCAHSHEYNQVWRYGIEVEYSAQDQIEKELCKIAEWIKEVL
ncbi:MAG: hypothetical protein K6U80_12310 [Firmicutes bacterium]|nr:hypothetical protein [Bacillota bacterium]